MRWMFLCAVLAGPATAACPPLPDQSAELAGLIAQARAAPSEQDGRAASDAMWQVWLRAPDEAAQEMLDTGMQQRGSYDFAGAYASFDALVTYCPAYAEGYNQRAFTSFLRQDFAAALVDLDAALQLVPNHVGAQSGRALTLMNLGRLDAARAQLRAALDNNPWLSERFLLADGGPLAVPGEDI